MRSAADARELDRREFLKATGSLVVGFNTVETLAAQGAPIIGGARGTVLGPPDEAQLDSFFAIHPNNSVTIFSGYVELGQGGPTALRQIAAEELGLDFDQVLTVRNDTFVCTNGATYASMTVGVGGVKLRAAAAEARRALLTLASERLRVPLEDLNVEKGVVRTKSDPQRSVTYGELLGDKPFNRKYEAVPYRGVGLELPRTNPNNAPPKPRGEYTIVGQRIPRFDIPDKVSGRYTYIQHVRIPGMVHGRVVWPRGQGAYAVSNPQVISIEEHSIQDIAGVKIIRRGNFVGAAAEREWDAVRAARQLKVTWDTFAPLPGSDGLHVSFRAAKTKDLIVADTGDATAAFQRATHVASATYVGPYQSHGTMAPNCAVADVKSDSALVMCSDQAIYQTRSAVAQLLGLSPDRVRVQFYSGSNTFGSSCYVEAALAAALMSKELGRPVRIQFSREDEFGWDNYAPAHLADLRGAVDEFGKIVAFEYQGWGHGSPGPSTVAQLALGAAPAVIDPNGGGLFQLRLSQNDMYDIPNRRIIDHRIPGAYLRIGALRAPLDPPYFFAQEGMLDELAHLARLDPYEFRKRNISHPRWLGVLKAATDAANWTPRVAASNISNAKIATGRGIALGTHHVPMNQGDRLTFAAAVVEIEVNKDTGVVVAKHVYGAIDCGLAVNPAIVESQIVGMSIHGTSLALKEEVTFDQAHVTSLDWNSYPALRFGEHPAVTPIVVQRINERSTGAGEEVLPAVVAAIGNAFFDATGVRLRQFPLTPRRVLAALKSASSNAPPSV